MRPSRVLASRGRVVRWPAVLLLAAAIVLMVVVDTDGTDDLDGNEALLERPLVPTAGRAESLSSTWYCAAGTIVEGGFADHTLVVANPSSVEAQVELTAFAVLAPQPITIDLESDNVIADVGLVPPEAVALGPTRSTVQVAPRSVERIRLADQGVGGEHAAVLVESNVGDMVVEHIVAGIAGASMAPCASSSAQEWHFAAGTTRKDAREVISIFNPFPGDAVIDMSFVADGTNRAPQIYGGLVVPSGTVLPVDISDVVTLFDVVSTDLSVRTGRVVVDRLVVVDGSEGAGGLSVAPGSIAPSGLWVLAANPAPGGVDAVVITNPSETEAIVDVEIRLDLPEFNGTVEPVGLTIRPGRTEVVVLSPGANLVSAGRVVDASDRILDDVGYWVTVRSSSATPVVVDHLVAAASPTPTAYAVSPALPVAATRHVMTTGDGGGEIVVVNPASDRIAQLELRLMSDGQEFMVLVGEVPQASRLVVDLEALGIGADGLLLVDTSEPVLIERRLALGTSGSFATPAIPVVGTTSSPIIPLG
jgi:hypothetical protein